MPSTSRLDYLVIAPHRYAWLLAKRYLFILFRAGFNRQFRRESPISQPANYQLTLSTNQLAVHNPESVDRATTFAKRELDGS